MSSSTQTLAPPPPSYQQQQQHSIQNQDNLQPPPHLSNDAIAQSAPAPAQPPPPTRPVSWSRRASTQLSRFGTLHSRSNSQDFDTLPHASPTWTQRLHNIRRSQSQGFIWDSLDNTMVEVQEARKMRKNGAIRLLTKSKDTSYNSVRSTLRLHYAEKRKSDLRNVVSSIRLSLDYDLYKARAMALLNSKARIMMDLVVDVLFCVLYLVEAQYLSSKDNSDYPNPKWLFVPRPRSIWLIAVAMSSWNLMSALIRFIFADNKWRFIFSMQTLLDAVTALPFLISGAFLPNGQYIYVPYFLRSWSVISRLQRALSIGVDIGISDQPFDPVKAKLIALVAYFAAIIYNGMAAFLYCEANFSTTDYPPHTILNAFYFILITASTVGYGDITPTSVEAKVVVMVFIIVALSVVPGLIAGMIDALKSARSGGGSYIQSRGANGVAKEYLVMIGDFQSSKRVADMLSGFFNKEFSDTDVRVVFLSRNKPSKDVKTLLEMPTHKSRVTMLVGNGLDEIDLKRCQARDAAGVFIIPDRPASDLESQDTMTTLLAWSLHIYAPCTRIFTFNLLPETETFQWGVVEQSMCIADVKQLLLAYNCRHRGTATLILNLLHPSEPANSYEDGWQAQYGDGTGNELYVGPIADVFIGWTFAQAAWFIFQEFQCILIGVDIFLRAENAFADRQGDGSYCRASHDLHRTKSRSSSAFRGLYDAEEKCPAGQYHLTLNPGNSYQLGKFDQLIYIAQSPTDVDTIEDFTIEQYEKILNDEKGNLNESRLDFAAAMDMYNTLRESRAAARAAARRRAEHRKDKKPRTGQDAATGSTGSFLKVPTTHNSSHFDKNNDVHNIHNIHNSIASGTHGMETLLSNDRWNEQDYQGSQSSHNMGSRSSSFRMKHHAPKKARPAWNVALYDDDDDDSLSDSSSLQRIKSGQSNRSRLSGQSQKNIQRTISRGKQAWGIGQGDKDMLMGGALEREERSQSSSLAKSPSRTQAQGTGEMIPLSETKLWSSRQGASPLAAHGSPMSSSSAFESSELYPSNFERNAAAAAMAEARLQSGLKSSPSHRHGSPMILGPSNDNNTTSLSLTTPDTSAVQGGASSSLSPLQAPIPRTVVSEFLEANTPKNGTQAPPVVSISPNPPCRGSATGGTPPSRGSVQGSFQTLDDLTYIGQTSVTRSETKDLPLCHLLINPPETVKPLIKEDLSSLMNHIVVCANAGENLYRFLTTLRLAQIGKDDLKTIVVLTRNPLETFTSDSGILDLEGDDALDVEDGGCSGGSWDAILSFPRVFWVSGNCRHQRDLVRAGILGASSIVVMAHRAAGLDRDEFADSTAIMAHHMIYQTLKQRDLLRRQHIIVEISERSNIRFLNMNNLASEKSHHGIVARSNQGSGSTFVMTPIFASGQVLVSSLLDNVLFQAYSKTHILDLIKLCCGVRFKQAIELDQMLGIDSSNICLMHTPEEFVGKSFGKLFQAFALRFGIVPLGLYRAPDVELNNSYSFIFTNPLPGILLKSEDRIYVLKS